MYGSVNTNTNSNSIRNAKNINPSAMFGDTLMNPKLSTIPNKTNMPKKIKLYCKLFLREVSSSNTLACSLASFSLTI